MVYFGLDTGPNISRVLLRSGNRRGYGPTLRATIDGHRHNFRVGDLRLLKKSGEQALKDILTQRQIQETKLTPDATEGLPFPLRFNPDDFLQAQPVLIHPLVEDHEYAYLALRQYKSRGGKNSLVLVINVDAHHDLGYKRFHKTINNSASWAHHLLAERLGEYLQFPSIHREKPRPREGMLVPRNESEDCLSFDFQQAATKLITKMKEKINGRFEVWATIDFDFFSLILEYHLRPTKIAGRLSQLTAFFQQNELPITNVLPCSSPAGLNLGNNRAKEKYVYEINRLITEAF